MADVPLAEAVDLGPERQQREVAREDDVVADDVGAVVGVGGAEAWDVDWVRQAAAWHLLTGGWCGGEHGDYGQYGGYGQHGRPWAGSSPAEHRNRTETNGERDVSQAKGDMRTETASPGRSGVGRDGSVARAEFM